MTREICIIHANCQGEPLAARLECCPEFRERYECRLFTNYVREPVPQQDLTRCALFLYQHLGPDWGELASERLAAMLPKQARTLCIPNMFFKGYWPTWTGRAGFDFRCELLDEYIDAGLSADEAVLVYQHADLSAKFDLPEILAETLRREREREARTPIKYTRIIEERHGREQLFNTVNHPGRLLMDHAARGILRELGLPGPDETALAALGAPFPELEQPIHPSAAAFFGWDFAGPNREYSIYGQRMTIAAWTARYVCARQNGVTDFIGFLQGAESPS
ncbi:WcbI family polysaccharide biosynthesis putative acetyltransferase [Pseudodesulfovibrio thermohalotolerans]|uniref:WcbI family polysaccharide biosynthesis putative acetyltransferase n=1 Tax=Pseudodesulfovibrio thermohalotolerans TaxID=2880651 RepID=UPI0022B9F534|nr:WcbI family polysaccharide biosynthesis putative acetyltransferase [Pseudodesulfovibrio thermohalotolerans]WFS62038.1 WcbI family polysaccharide biosynthesis putative acetyltransferase [Pseudodesulfovibrio thermohalotolerans]